MTVYFPASSWRCARLLRPALDYPPSRFVGSDRARRPGRRHHVAARKSSSATTRIPRCTRPPSSWPAISRRSAGTSPPSSRRRPRDRVNIRLVTLGHGEVPAAINAGAMQGQWESYRIVTAGRDGLARWAPTRAAPRSPPTRLSERLGIDPLYIWTGYRPEHRDPLVLKRTELRAGSAGLPLSRLLPRRRGPAAAPLRRQRLSPADRRRPARLVQALLRDRAAPAHEHGGALHARPPPLRSAEAGQRLGPLLHVAPLRHPGLQSVRPGDASTWPPSAACGPSGTGSPTARAC